MHPVNIQLNVSGTQQLKFLEEIISLLHIHQDAQDGSRELDSDVPMTVTSPATGTQLPHMHSPCVSEEGMEDDHCASSANIDTGKKDLTTPPLGSFLDSAPQYHHNHHTTFRKFGDGSSIYPHPPASPPPQSALSAMKFRKTVRPQTEKHYRATFELELSPHHYLNEAELALIYSQQPLSFARINMDMKPPAMPWSRSGELKGREACRSDYWLRDSSEQRLQDWLLKKDKECLLQRRNDLKRHRLKCKEREATAIQEIEKAKRAKLAYQTWLDKKREEDKRARRRRSVSVHPIPLKGSVQSLIQPQRPCSVQPQSSIIRRPLKQRQKQKQKQLHVPLKAQLQQNNPTSSISKRLTFKEWVQLKERDRKNTSSREGQVPEDFQKIARGMRKMRLQQKDCSKKRVDSGLKNHQVDITASSKDSKTAGSPAATRHQTQ